VKENKLNIAIIGAGVAGLTAAYELSKDAHRIVVYEASDAVGGLASGFKDEGWEWPLERFYHHWFASDDAVIDLIEKLGASDRLFFRWPTTSFYHEGQIYPLDSPVPWLKFLPMSQVHRAVRVLQFKPLPFVDRLRIGLSAFYLTLTKDWRPLERTTAHEWMCRKVGERAYNLWWKPLLVGKFGDYYQDVNMAWLWARAYKRTAQLGYFVGGFQAFADLLAEAVRSQGADIRLKAPIGAIEALPEGGLMVRAPGGDECFDRVIATVSPGLLARLTPALPDTYLEGLRQLKSMGAVVLILALKQQLTDGHYWVNLPKDEGFPFLALVEHTNYIDAGHYGGDHLVYCGDYLKPDHEYFSLSHAELLERFLPALARFNPNFKPEWVRKSWLFREKYAQPVPPLNHSRNIPDLATPVPGLYWASMSQVYPWDRGTNYAVEIGQQVARRAVEPSL
jgi:protoporphyrinogen oxidase